MTKFHTVDEQGKVEVVLEQTSTIDDGSLDGPSSIDGLKTFVLQSTGEKLNRLESGDFQTVTGRTLRVVSNKAI